MTKLSKCAPLYDSLQAEEAKFIVDHNEGEIGEAAYLDQAVDAHPMHYHAASWWKSNYETNRDTDIHWCGLRPT